MPSAASIVEDGLRVVGRVHHDRLAGLPVADQVDEVHHLLGDGIVASATSSPASSWRK
jgi:hypothetical protein